MTQALHRTRGWQIADRIVGWLFAIGGVLHAVGSYAAYPFFSQTLLWAWCASIAVFMIAGINLLRVGRPGDRSLARLALGGSLAWVVAALAFGVTIGNLADPRALINAAEALILAGFSIAPALGRATTSVPPLSVPLTS